MADDRFEIATFIQDAVSRAVDAGWTNEEILEEVEAALASAWEPEE